MPIESVKIGDEEFEAALARGNYGFYCEYVHRGFYEHARHTEYICSKLEAVERGDLKRVMLFMPPRHSKSMTVTETFPSFFIGRNPDRRVIAVSYSGDLAYRFGKANRSKLNEFGGSIFGVSLSREKTSMTNWEVGEHRGGMLSVGVGGSITGQGADLMIIDDPIKNRMEADSITYRNRLWDEWQNTLLTRLQPGAAVIIILTRWHEDDLAGRILNFDKENWEIIRLPAICEDEAGDPLGRRTGETLWPEKYDWKWAVNKKREVGSYVWNALYQQQPSPPEGNIIQRKWWRYYRQAPSRFDEIIQSWDCAFKDEQTSDYVVGQVWGRRGADKYLLDQVRGRMDFPSTVRAVESLSAKWPQARAKLIEDKANGPAVISTLKSKISGLIPVNPEGGKMARLQAVSPDIEAGNIYLPEPSIAAWVHDYVEEFAAFPNGANDDQVDATSQALLRLGSGRRIAKIYGRKPAGW